MAKGHTVVGVKGSVPVVLLGGRGSKFGTLGQKGVVWERCLEMVLFPIALLCFEWQEISSF